LLPRTVEQIWQRAILLSIPTIARLVEMTLWPRLVFQRSAV
jgi:hypothetical protein